MARSYGLSAPCVAGHRGRYQAALRDARSRST